MRSTARSSSDWTCTDPKEGASSAGFEPRLQRLDVGQHQLHHLREAEPLPNHHCVGVRRQHVEADVRHASLGERRHDLADERPQHAASAGARPHVRVRQVRSRRLRLGGEDVADCAVVVLGNRGESRSGIPGKVGPGLLPALAEARRRRNLPLELLPELADDRLVRLGRAPDLHGAISPARR
jgi:hypothetical protein